MKLIDKIKNFLFGRERYRRYRRIIDLHEAINKERENLKNLQALAETYPEAAVQRDVCRIRLQHMYSDIYMLMHNYRLSYPKKKH